MSGSSASPEELALTPLAGRARLLFYLQAFSRLIMVWVPFTITGAVLGASFIHPLWAPLAALVWLFLMFLTALWWPSLAFDRWGYALRDEDLIITRGVLLRSVSAIPTSRIQHVDTRQGPLEQWLGLARLQVYTASGVGADGVVPGLNLEDAEALRDQLVAVKGGDDGV